MFEPWDVFWKRANVYDVLGALGFVVGVGSVWYAWWLAKRDLRRKIGDARQAVLRLADRVTVALVESDVSAVLRSLLDTREAIRRRDWVRGVLRLDDAEHHLVRVNESEPVLRPEEAAILRRVVDGLSLLRGHLNKLTRGPSDQAFTDRRMTALDTTITGLARIDGRLRRRLREGDDVPAGDRGTVPPPSQDEGGAG